MISPAKMKKIEILLLKEDKDEIVDDLYDLECVELVECEVCAKFPVPPTTLAIMLPRRKARFLTASGASGWTRRKWASYQQRSSSSRLTIS
jgi:hypothetical protein